MTTLTQDQVYERWDTLPLTLREALTSEVSSDYVWKVSESEHIPEEKIFGVGRAVSHVLYGFVHPEDLAEELRNDVGLGAPTATAIATSINQRIFAPIRSDLDKSYQPLGKPPLKVMQDVGPAPVPNGPQVISKIATGAATFGAVPLVTNQSRPAPAPIAPAAAPKPPSQAGWSRSTSAEPVVKLNQTVSPLPKPAAPTAASAQTTRPGASLPMKGIGEFERMTIQKTPIPVPGKAPVATPTAPTGPAPVIIHEDASFKAAPKPADFHLSLPADQLAGGKSDTPARAQAVVLELGKNSMIQPPTKPAAAPTTNTVHYTDYIKQNPSSATERKITEMTSAPITPPTSAPASPQNQFTPPSGKPMGMGTSFPTAQRPVVAAPPPMPPKPPAAPQVQIQSPTQPQNKVIHVDYTDPPKPPTKGI